MRRFDVINLGLPRSGTTSFASSATQRGMRSHAPVATWLVANRWSLDTFDRHTLPEGPRRVATMRSNMHQWLRSAARYSQLSEDYLRDVAGCWLDWVERQGDVQFIDVADPPPEWQPFPHLNRGPLLPPMTDEERARLHDKLDDMLIDAGGGLP